MAFTPDSDPKAVFKLKRDLSAIKKIPHGTKKAHAVHALKVLIVDDNQNAADTLDQLLTLHGYEVVVAYSGAEALQKTLTFLPQMAILDIAMPEMDGYQLLALLQKRLSGCSYLALTGFGRAADKKDALKAGFGSHLTKPADLKDIEMILEKVAFQMKK